MADLDKTKENIGISRLDEDTRKKMFEKFVDSGGEVVSEKKKRMERLTIDREKQKQYLRNFEESKKKIQKSTLPAQKKRQNQRLPVKKSAESRKVSVFDRLHLKILLRMNRIILFNSLYFHKKFLERFNNQYNPALIQVQMAYIEIILRDPNMGRRIIERLDNMKPLYYELIDITGNMYDKITSDRIVEHYLDFPDVPKKASELKEPLMSLFRKLYLVRPYEMTIATAYSRAIDLYTRVDESSASEISSMKKNVKNGLNVIFQKLYPRLHLLFCHYNGILFDDQDSEIDRILDIKEEERPGKRVFSMRHETDEEAADTEEPAEIPEETVSDIPDDVKKGLSLMYNLDMKQLRKEYDREGTFNLINDDDNVLVTFLLFSEFDREYSLILTSNKIKYSVKYGAQGKFDYRVRIQQIFDEMRKPVAALKKYAEEVAKFEKVRRQKPLSSNQYIDYTKRLESMEKTMIQTGKIARMSVKSFMDIIAKECRRLIDDMEGTQEYITNPQDIINFEFNIEGEKKLNGKKVYQAIQLVYFYALALSYRLSEGGDLTGSIQQNDTKKEADESMNNKTKPSGDDGSTSDKSVLDELDDML